MHVYVCLILFVPILGLGRLIHIFPGDRPVRMALNYSGHIPEESRKILMDFPLNRINQLSCSRQKHSSSQQPSVAMELQSSAAMETLPSVSVPMVTESFSESKSESCDSYAGEKPIPIVSSKTGNNAIGNGDEEQENVLDDSLVGEEGSGSDEGSSQLEDEEDDGTPASKRLKTSTEQISQEVSRPHNELSCWLHIPNLNLQKYHMSTNKHS